MRIEKSKVDTIEITEVKSLDPITVFIEDLNPGQGRITIECYGDTWSYYWGAMDGRTISQFFCQAPVDYLIDKLGNGMRSRFYERPEDEEGIPNSDYDYLCRIINAVRDAFKQI